MRHAIFNSDAEAAKAVARKFRLEGYNFSDWQTVAEVFTRYVGAATVCEFVGDNPTERVVIIQLYLTRHAVVCDYGLISADVDAWNVRKYLKNNGFTRVRSEHWPTQKYSS